METLKLQVKKEKLTLQGELERLKLQGELLAKDRQLQVGDWQLQMGLGHRALGLSPQPRRAPLRAKLVAGA